VKYYRSTAHILPEGKDEEVLLRNPIENQLREVSEAEPFVVIGVTHQDASLGSQGLQQGQTLTDEGFADALRMIIFNPDPHHDRYSEDGGKEVRPLLFCSLGNQHDLSELATVFEVFEGFAPLAQRHHTVDDEF